MRGTPVRTVVVTGALGYSGKAIAERLLDRGVRVRTLTNSPDRPNPFGDRLEIRPMRFDRPGELGESLRGADVLVNTYWVRFNRPRGRVRFTHAGAVENTRRLFDAARAAGVRRVVHVSILNPAGADEPGVETDPARRSRGLSTRSGRLAARLSYYSGKAELEGVLRGSGLSHAIVRPGVLFGRRDILVNNIAWVLRHVPVFGLFRGGRYGIRPMHVDDFADLVVRRAFEEADTVTDAVGPERFEFRGLVREIARLIGVRRPMVSVPNWAGVLASAAVGALVDDVVLTRDEIRALTAGLLDSDAASTGSVRLTDWVAEHAGTLGRVYHSEMARRLDRVSGYSEPDRVLAE